MTQFSGLLKVVRERGGNGTLRGRPWSLPLAERVLMVAVYYRTKLTIAAAGPAVRRLSSTVCRAIQRLGPLLALEPVTRTADAADRLWIVDGTLVPVRDRSVGSSSRNYRFSANVQVIVDADTRLVNAAARPVPGTTADAHAWLASGLAGHCQDVTGVVAVGTKVPSTISTVSLRNRLRGCNVSDGPKWSMMRSAAYFETPKSGASWLRVRFVRQYAATNRTRSSRGRLHGRPLRTGSAPSRRSAVISLPNWRGLNPVNGAIHEGSGAVITPVTRRSFQLPPPFSAADPGYLVVEEDAVGLVLFPGDGDVTSPDVSWSYTGFGVFRRWLAQAEGFDLSEMHGFGGQCLWSDASTTLAPLLNHPDDDGPDLTPAQCAAILPRLAEIAQQRPETCNDPILQRHIDDASQLVAVLQLCVEKDLDLIFG